jgi:adenylate kinase family enzyme
MKAGFRARRECADALLLIGPTGAGKTPLGDHIEKHGMKGRRCLHFDFGHQLRTIAEGDSPPGGFSQKDHAFIKGVLEKGFLLEDAHFHIANKILGLFLGRRSFNRDDMLVLNGLPRHAGQARDIKTVVKIRGLVVLECTAEDVYERIRENTGKDRTGRTDDRLEMVRRKLDIFRERTGPLVDYYAGAGTDILRIKVTAASTPEELYSSLCSSDLIN